MSKLSIASSDFFRKGCFVAALWYFLASSSLVALAIDKIFPRFKTINPSASSYALHSCGCKHSKESQKGCCCFPRIPQPKVCGLRNHSLSQNEPPRQIRMDFLSAARCKGHLGDDAVLLSQLEPHLLPFSSGIQKEVNTHPLYPRSTNMPYNLFLQPLEKVPIRYFFQP